MFLQNGNMMPEGLYNEYPLTSYDRDEYDSNLIAFCHRNLSFLDDIEWLKVL